MASDLKSIVAVDVETTGLHSNDRIVSLGAWRVNAESMTTDALEFEHIHFIFDPGKKSHPRAEEVHGYSDWTLRHQPPFSEYAKVVRDFLLSGNVVVAHNASFDLEFIDREYRALGQQELECHRYCTMNGYRQLGLPGRASLNAVCEKIGLKRIDKTHGALEDAWLALMVHLWLHKAPSKCIQPFSQIIEKGIVVGPKNYREPPPLPDGPLPRRSSKSNASESDKPRANDTAKALLKDVRPTAILLLEIARANGSMAAEEIDTLTSLIRSATERLGLQIDEAAERHLIAELFDIELSQNLLTRSARALCENTAARDAFPKWLATMATVDGEFSAAEREAVDRVKAAIKRVLPDQ